MVEDKSGMTLSEIANKVSLPKTTIFRILHTLENEGIVEKYKERYKIGFKLIKLGLQSLGSLDIRNIAISHLHDLSIKLKETTHLAILSDKKSLIIEVCDSSDPVNISARPGKTVDLYCSATGKILLAFKIGENNLDDYLKDIRLSKKTENTITSIKNLKAEIKIILNNGYAVDNEEYYEGIRCLSAPVRDAFGKTVAAIGVTASSYRFKESMIEEIANEVISTSNIISQKLGA
jgi:DNA-binding IclR family transcriptional regulator